MESCRSRFVGTGDKRTESNRLSCEVVRASTGGGRQPGLSKQHGPLCGCRSPHCWSPERSWVSSTGAKCISVRCVRKHYQSLQPSNSRKSREEPWIWWRPACHGEKTGVSWTASQVRIHNGPGFPNSPGSWRPSKAAPPSSPCRPHTRPSALPLEV